jgi:quaternary ammonium compound-resistance protein SugE
MASKSAVPDKTSMSLTEKRKGWTFLLLASIFEVLFALSTNASQGFTVMWGSIATVITATIGVFLLSRSLQYLDVGIGYTVWVGIGSVGTVVFGAILFGEDITFLKSICFVLIIGGVMELKLADKLSVQTA